MKIVTNGSKVADFAAGNGLSDGNGVLVDFLAEVECNGIYGVLDTRSSTGSIGAPSRDGW